MEAPTSVYARIFTVIAMIPEGRVATYGQIAALAGIGRRARQVGYALASLPDGHEVPWHRVINAKGEISIRARTDGHETQRTLLEDEGVTFDVAGRVELSRFRWQPGFEVPAAGEAAS